MYTLEGVSSVAIFITAYEESQLVLVLHHNADYISFPLGSLGP